MKELAKGEPQETEDLHQGVDTMKAADKSRESVHEEVPQSKRGRKGRPTDDLKKVFFRWSRDLDRRLNHYVADFEYETHLSVGRTGVVVEALEKFLKSKGY